MGVVVPLLLVNGLIRLSHLSSTWCKVILVVTKWPGSAELPDRNKFLKPNFCQKSQIKVNAHKMAKLRSYYF